MARNYIVATLTLLVCVAYGSSTSISRRSSPPVVSVQDQYAEKEEKHEGSHLPQALDEATDPLTIRVPHRFSGLHNKQRTEIAEVPELQVGCADGLLKTSQDKVAKDKQTEVKPRGKREAENRRKRRGFYPFPGQVIQAAPLQSFTYYDPPVYQIQRPYVIPVWGAPNRVPIYFPPQPLYSNPGFPVHNPPSGLPPNREYLPVPPPNGYLPPSTEMPTDNRFGDGDIYDDRPVWGLEPGNSIDNGGPTTEAIPTRAPRPNNPTDFPPLVHGSGTGSGNDLAAGRPDTNLIRTTTRRPATVRPPISQTRPPISQTRPPISQTRPPINQTRPPISQTRPPTQNVPTPSPEATNISRCVLATISCCSGVNNVVSYSCFEQLGCNGAFWDTNPCDSEFAKAAIAAALNYYN